MTAPVRPETVGELIENLKLLPADMKLNFAPFTLYRTKDRGECCFEWNEIEGDDYELLQRDEPSVDDND